MPIFSLGNESTPPPVVQTERERAAAFVRPPEAERGTEVPHAFGNAELDNKYIVYYRPKYENMGGRGGGRGLTIILYSAYDRTNPTKAVTGGTVSIENLKKQLPEFKQSERTPPPVVQTAREASTSQAQMTFGNGGKVYKPPSFIEKATSRLNNSFIPWWVWGIAGIIVIGGGTLIGRRLARKRS